jgi:hypothetical protein
MGLKIKWNDDRVRGAITAILLLGRARLARGETAAGVADSLAEYRVDAERYKMNKAAWPAPTEMGPLMRPAQIASYQQLLAATERLRKKIAQNKIQFNSLRELDNWLIASLGDVSR